MTIVPSPTPKKNTTIMPTWLQRSASHPAGSAPTPKRMPFYLTPEQDDFNKIPELQACIAEALYDVDSEAYT